MIQRKVGFIGIGVMGEALLRGMLAAGAAALWADGTVSEAIELARNNKLTICDKANVEGHWT